MKLLKIALVSIMAILSTACSTAENKTAEELVVENYVSAMVQIATIEEGSRAESHLKGCNGLATDLEFIKSIAGTPKATGCALSLTSYAKRNNTVEFANVKKDFEANYKKVLSKVFKI
tara:strand:+ start:801 stop:1154 length:354 start_codon:yes stop_codon:yes gene_type:complete